MKSLSPSIFSSSLFCSKILPSCLSTFVFFMIIMLATPAPALKLPPSVKVPAIIVFGDSIVDSGNNNYIKTLVKSNFPPYGRDFMGGRPTGRFSNGRILTDFLVEEFSIKQYMPPYLDPNLGPEDLLTGVSFASGGSGYDPLTSKITLVISLSQQLEHFRDYIRKVKQLVGEEKTQFTLNNSIFMVLTGNNDLFGYFDIPLRRLQYDIYSYTDFLVNLASCFVQEEHRKRWQEYRSSQPSTDTSSGSPPLSEHDIWVEGNLTKKGCVYSLGAEGVLMKQRSRLSTSSRYSSVKNYNAREMAMRLNEGAVKAAEEARQKELEEFRREVEQLKAKEAKVATELAQEKAARQRDKSKISKLWRFFKSQQVGSSTAPPDSTPLGDDDDDDDEADLDDSSHE